jgi:hypothetical protein
MTDEEMQNTMQFILSTEAKTTVRLDVLAEKVDGLAGRVEGLAVSQERNEKKWERTEEGIRLLLSIAEIHEREMAIHEREIATLSENGRATDERLNALISVVERDISERRNGKS